MLKIHVVRDPICWQLEGYPDRVEQVYNRYYYKLHTRMGGCKHLGYSYDSSFGDRHIWHDCVITRWNGMSKLPSRNGHWNQ